jgi:hypothetical protein
VTTPPKCPYCSNDAVLVTGREIYRITPKLEHVADKRFWQCKPCDAYCGCHPSTRHTGYSDSVPLGTLADAELRAARNRAHAALDPYWQNKIAPRTKVYARLARELQIPSEHCHIAMFNVRRCEAVVKTCQGWSGLWE